MIVHLIRIFFHIVKFPLIYIIIEVNKLITIGTHTVVRLYIVPFGILKILVIGRPTPVFLRLFIILQQPLHTPALHIFRNLNTGKIKQCRSNIHIQCQVFQTHSFLHAVRIAYQARHLQGFFIHPTFVVQAMFTEKKSLIAHVYNDGIVIQAFFFQIGHHTTYLIIHRTDHTQIVFQICLKLPFLQFFAFQFRIRCPELVFTRSTPPKPFITFLLGESFRRSLFQVTTRKVVFNCPHRLPERFLTTFIIIIKCGGIREFHLVKKIQIAGIWFPWTMRCFIVQHQAERLAYVT